MTIKTYAPKDVQITITPYKGKAIEFKSIALPPISRQVGKMLTFGHRGMYGTLKGTDVARAEANQQSLERFRATMVDGETPATCLERFKANQQSDLSRYLMTPRQREVASAMWTAELKLKAIAHKAEQASRDRLQVVVERDEDGE